MALVKFYIFPSVDEKTSTDIRQHVDNLSNGNTVEILHIYLQKKFDQLVVAFDECKATFQIMDWNSARDIFSDKDTFNNTHLKDDIFANEVKTEVGDLYILDYVYDRLK